MPDGRQRREPGQTGLQRGFHTTHREPVTAGIVSEVLAHYRGLWVTSSGRPLSGTLHRSSWRMYSTFRIHLLVMIQRGQLLQFVALRALSSSLDEALNSTMFEIALGQSSGQSGHYSLVSVSMLEICRPLHHFGEHS